MGLIGDSLKSICLETTEQVLEYRPNLIRYSKEPSLVDLVKFYYEKAADSGICSDAEANEWAKRYIAHIKCFCQEIDL